MGNSKVITIGDLSYGGSAASSITQVGFCASLCHYTRYGDNGVRNSPFGTHPGNAGVTRMRSVRAILNHVAGSQIKALAGDNAIAVGVDQSVAAEIVWRTAT